MCYSKEVQLITALIILLSTFVFYIIYSKKFSNSNKKWLKPFLNNVMLVFLCIGFHQFFEFLSLVTNNQAVYKAGLIISVSSVYFLLRSLEILINKKLHSNIALVLIGGLAVYLFSINMSFEGISFYLRHNSGLIWASLWMFLFIYWHICAFSAIRSLKDSKSKKTIIWYLMAVADVSFILSALYVIFGFFFYSVNVCTDAPSIWCTFYVLQAVFIPFFLTALPFTFMRQKKLTALSSKRTLLYLAIALIILISLILILPFFNCLTWKLAFP